MPLALVEHGAFGGAGAAAGVHQCAEIFGPRVHRCMRMLHALNVMMGSRFSVNAVIMPIQTKP